MRRRQEARQLKLLVPYEVGCLATATAFRVATPLPQTPRFVIVLLTCPDTLEGGLTLIDRLKLGIVLIPTELVAPASIWPALDSAVSGRRLA